MQNRTQRVLFRDHSTPKNHPHFYCERVLSISQAVQRVVSPKFAGAVRLMAWPLLNCGLQIRSPISTQPTAKEKQRSMTIEIMAIICALFFMFAVVLAKVTTIRLFLRMKELIKNVQEQRVELVRELRDITAERNKTSIERILEKREKKLRTLQRELREFANEDERKKTKREEMKKHLAR
jgi:C4-dicarboxylate-specific signal transduction histidine kinase